MTSCRDVSVFGYFYITWAVIIPMMFACLGVTKRLYLLYTYTQPANEVSYCHESGFDMFVFGTYVGPGERIQQYLSSWLKLKKHGIHFSSPSLI